jgi:hypothetical protein
MAANPPPSPCSKCGAPHVTHHGHRACSAHRTHDGKPCSKPRLAGQEICGSHGGKTRQNLTAGKRRVTERKALAMAARWGVPVTISGTEAMIEQVHVWASIERFYRDRVNELTPEQMIWGRTKTVEGDVVVGNGPTASLESANTTTEESKPNAWIILHEGASQNLVKFAAAAISAGIEERRVHLAEQQGALVADVIKRILDALHLTPQQLSLVPEVVPTALRLLTA